MSTAERSSAPVTDGAAASELRWRQLEALLALATVFVIAVRLSLPSQVPAGFAMIIVTAPVWLRIAWRRAAARWLVYGLGLALLYGLVLTLYAPLSHTVSRSPLVGEFSLVAVALGGGLAVMWSAELVGGRATGLAFGLGILAGIPLHHVNSDMNFWKGTYALPVAIIALALCYRSRLGSVVVLLALAGLSAVFDSRSYLAVFAVSAVIALGTLLPRQRGPRRSWLGLAWALALLGVIAYFGLTALLVDGYLGVGAQQRSIQQIDLNGTLLLGGRPEIAATAALMMARFWGFGFGVLPNSTDLTVAKEGLLAINYDPDNGYVERYMFGSGFELHSVLGDVWVRTGPVGLLVVLGVAVGLLRNLGLSVSNRRPSGLILFLTLWSFWNMGFSPLLTSYPPLVLAVGLALYRDEGTTGDRQSGQ